MQFLGFGRQSMKHWHFLWIQHHASSAMPQENIYFWGMSMRCMQLSAIYPTVNVASIYSSGYVSKLRIPLLGLFAFEMGASIFLWPTSWDVQTEFRSTLTKAGQLLCSAPFFLFHCQAASIRVYATNFGAVFHESMLLLLAGCLMGDYRYLPFSHNVLAPKCFHQKALATPSSSILNKSSIRCNTCLHRIKDLNKQFIACNTPLTRKVSTKNHFDTTYFAQIMRYR